MLICASPDGWVYQGCVRRSGTPSAWWLGRRRNASYKPMVAVRFSWNFLTSIRVGFSQVRDARRFSLRRRIGPLNQGAFRMTRTLALLSAAFAAVPAVVLAQVTASTPGQTPAATANPISSSHSKMYSMLSGVVIAAAEKMPEEDYSFRPTSDVRTFGQLVGHLADSQYYFCSSVAGETRPPAGIEKSKTRKADLVAALKEAVAYCGKVYASMTDAKGSQMMKLMNTDMAKLTVLSGNTAHDYEHYGNMATYMRIKGLVPPTSEKRGGPEQK